MLNGPVNAFKNNTVKGIVYACQLELKLEEEQDGEDIFLTVATLMKRKKRRHRLDGRSILPYKIDGTMEHTTTLLLNYRRMNTESMGCMCP